MKSYDVIVIGAGHNGLIVASKLAASGRKVLLLEAGETYGGGWFDGGKHLSRRINF